MPAKDQFLLWRYQGRLGMTAAVHADRSNHKPSAVNIRPTNGAVRSSTLGLLVRRIGPVSRRTGLPRARPFASFRFERSLLDEGAWAWAAPSMVVGT
jgi:hypothetical protein